MADDISALVKELRELLEKRARAQFWIREEMINEQIAERLPALLDALERGRDATIEECAKVAERSYEEARKGAEHYAGVGDRSHALCMAKALVSKEIEIALRSLSTPGKG